MSQSSPRFTIRELNSVEELKRSETLQHEVWGEDDPADNSDIMHALQSVGGLVAGAFADGRMIGFLLAFPTSESDVQHSHRLAVHPDSRGLGLGTALKWYQRNWCLERGITTVRWTYDPLRRANAVLNIARLGATSAVYYPDYYGKMVGINAGVASDRLLVDWHLTAPNVVRRAENPSGPISIADTSESIHISIPADFDALLSNDLESAIAYRLQVRASLIDAFANGLHISGFDRETNEYHLSSL